MNFPERDRVIYKNNPLVEVVFQLRFSRILALDQSVPAGFQEALGSAYPHVSLRPTMQLDAISGQNSMQTKSPEIYDFADLGQETAISVCSEFLAVRASKYENWQVFHTHIERALSSLVQNYGTPFITRVGLRYVNVLDKAEIGLDDAKWREIIAPQVLGALGHNDTSEADFQQYFSTFALNLDTGKVQIRCQLLAEPSQSGNKFVVDCDFFEEKAGMSWGELYDILPKFNASARNAFRWIVTEATHRALRP